jgi:WD40 repeat protein
VDRGRARLRQRLTRRGITLSAALLATVVLPNVPVSAALVQETARMTTGLVRAPIAALADAVGRGLFIARFKLVVLLVAASMALTAFGYQLAAVSEPVNESARPAAKSVAGETPPKTDRYGDPLPEGAIARLGTVRWRHDGGVGHVVFSPDDKILAAGGNETFLFDVRTGKQLRCLPAMPRGKWGKAIHFSHDGKTLLVAGAEEISFWDVATGKQVRSLPRGDFPMGLGVCFSPDGKLLARTSHLDQAYLVDVGTGKLLHQVGGHRACFYGLAFSPDSTILALGTLGPAVQLWDVKTGKLLCGMDHHQGQFVFGLAFSPDGKTIASGSSNLIVLSDVASGKELGRIEAKMRTVQGLTFTPDGKTLMSLSEEDGTVRMWDVNERKVRSVCTGRFGMGRSLALSHDGKTMVQATASSTLCIWDVATGKERFTEFAGHDTAVNCIAFSPDGKVLLSVGDKQHLCFWDTKSWKPAGEWKESARSLSFTPDGRKVALVPSFERVIRVKDVANGKTELELPVPDVDYVWRASFARGGQLLVSVDSNRALGGTPKGTARLVVWDSGTGQQLRKLPLPGVIPESLAVTRDGSWAFVGDTEGALHTCNLDAGRVTQVAQVGRGPDNHTVVALALSPDDRLLLSGSLDRQVRLWERITGKEIHTFQGHSRALAAVAFSPNGRLAASAGGNLAYPYPEVGPRKIRLWDTVTGKELAQFQGHEADVTSLEFSPDGSLLACGLRNATVLVWAIPAELRTMRGPTQRVKDEDLPRLWEELAGDDVSLARRALWTLVDSDDQAVRFLQSRLKPTPPIDGKQVQRWIADLGSDEFGTREKATGELIEVCELVEPALKKALDNQPTPEGQRRLNQVLNRAQRGIPSNGTIRSLRAVEVLERIGTGEALNVLKALAKGAPEARLTHEAKAALERLTRRTGP